MVSAGTEELRLLAALLAIPTGESLPLLREQAAAHRWLRAALAELERLPLDVWQAEHTRLFINGYPETPCPPFATHWRGGCQQGCTVEDLAALLARIGLVSGEVPPDYLGLLLECSAWLQAHGAAPARALHGELWEVHLQPWLPRYAAALRRHSRLRLYRLLGARLGRLRAVCETVNSRRCAAAPACRR